MKKLVLSVLMSFCALTMFAQISEEGFFRLCATGAIGDVRIAAAAGANINAWGEIKDADGFTSYYTCLMIACKNENVDVVEFLLDHGARPNPHSREYPIHYVLNWQRSDLQTIMRIIRKLHAKGAEIDARTTMGQSPLLMAAVDPQKEDIGLLLIELGADVNVRDVDANTPLLTVLASGMANTMQHRLIEKLVSSGANTNAKNKLGENAYSILQKYDKRKSSEVNYYSWYWKIMDNYYNGNV
ncbi:MAG: ankyrin repeat domain-containing protein [Spirochaetaceae bacterium]|jgi:ankyrin repeat protein|nr:ankyrin repeat domain-containing protein [Spirochaetaceae bacterium]